MELTSELNKLVKEKCIMLDLELREYIKCSKEEKRDCLPLIEEIVGWAEMAVKGGLLDLEDEVIGVKNQLLKTGMSLVIDGCESEIVKSVMDDMIVASGKTGVELLRQLIVREGVLSIQSGYNPRIIELRLSAMLGEEIFADG